MILTRTRALVLAAVAALPLTGCIDADIQAKVTADGSGTMSVKMGLTEGIVQAMSKLRELDPNDDSLHKFDAATFEKPTEEEAAKLKELGLEILSVDSVATDTKVEGSVKVAFKTLAALEGMKALEKEGASDEGLPTSGFSLTREEDGTYVLSMGKDADDESAEEEEGIEGPEMPEDDTSAGGTEDPELEAKKAAAAMELMGALMADMAKLKIVIAMDVPGEIVSFSPASMGAKEGSKVTWTMDFQAMMAAQMAEDGAESMQDGFSVRFRMPEGQEIPAAALTKAVEKTETESGDK